MPFRCCILFGGPSAERNISAGSIKPWLTYLADEDGVELTVLFVDREERAFLLPRRFGFTNTCEDFEQILDAGDALDDERVRAVVDALRPELAPRLTDAAALGLGDVPLHTPVDDLSAESHLSHPARRARLRAHLAEALTEIARVAQPIVVLIGELNRADTLTLELLAGLLKEVQSPESPVHFVATVRSARLDDRTSDLTRRFPTPTRVALEALSERDVAVAVGNMLGRRPPPAELARRLHQATGGQPLYLEDAVYQMVDTGGIEADGSRLAWADQAMEIQVPDRAENAAVAQLERMPVSWRRVIEALAVAGSGAKIPLLAHVLGWEPAALLPVVEAIEREGSSFDRFYRTPKGQPGSYQHQFQVYGRAGQPCRTCGRPIKRIVVGQRGTWLCTRCQAAPRPGTITRP